MISTDKILFSLQMAEESFQEVQLLLKDGKTRSLLNSLYNVFYYGMEAVLFNQDIHCRSHAELKKAFIEKVIQAGIFQKQPADNRRSLSLEKEIEKIFKIKEENEKGKSFTPEEVQRLIQTGEAFLKSVKNHLLI